MHWSIVRLIWHRELRDLMRDRRWLFMLLGLPILLYPAFGLFGFVFAQTLVDQPLRVGIHGLEFLPRPPAGSLVGPAAEVSWLSVLPSTGGSGIAGLVGADAAVTVLRPLTADPPLVAQSTEAFHFIEDFCTSSHEARLLHVYPVAALDHSALDARLIDVLLSVPSDFCERLANSETPAIELSSREGDEMSKLAAKRVGGVLRSYRSALRMARFARAGLPPDFDQTLVIRDPDQAKPALQRSVDELRDALVRFFPFMLVMWTLTGALYPAVDLCAGEKERGTMETLLISPADRVEIVGGKFLAVWTLSTVTAWWNLLWMGGGAIVGGSLLGLELVRPSGLFWCFVLTLPLAALFSAPCLALGIYARSTKEGQYYLLPIFITAMPLVLVSLSPGIELNLKTSLIPVTGVCLLVQNLIFTPQGATPWVYAPTVLLSLAVCIAVALRWAVWQFHREDVLFRESDRAGWRSALRKLFPAPGVRQHSASGHSGRPQL